MGVLVATRSHAAPHHTAADYNNKFTFILVSYLISLIVIDVTI